MNQQLSTDKLKTGDLVLTDGMRVRLGPVKTWSSQHGTVYGFEGTVENLPEVLAAGHVPASFLQTTKWVDAEGWVIDRRDSWTIQGNQYASWVVESPA